MKVVFIDGECLFCHGLVGFILNRMGEEKLFFSSLQGETAKRLLPEKYRIDLDTVVFFDEDKILVKSHAVFTILKYLNSPLRFFYFLVYIPSFITNFFYDLVAKNRFKISKKYCGNVFIHKDKFI